MKKILKIIQIFLLVYLYFGGMIFSADWNFMVYMDGDNDLDIATNGDINEMLSVSDTENVNILLLVDKSYYSDTHLYRIVNGSKVNLDQYLWDEEVNMGNPVTLQRFIQFCIENYPATKNALILWNHGSGWRAPSRACCQDVINSDWLYTSEIQEGIRIAKEQGVVIDLIGFDACLMGMIEVDYELKDLCDVVVSSEASEPFWGWPYDTILNDLVNYSTMTASDFSKVIVNRYKQRYSGIDYETTLSAVDMKYLDSVITAINEFSNSMSFFAVNPEWQRIQKARQSCCAFSEESGYYGIDLWNFVDKIEQNCLNENVKEKASNVKAALESFIISNYAGFLVGENTSYNAKGRAIYFPEDKTDFVESYTDENKRYPVKFVSDNKWSNFLQRYYNPATGIEKVTSGPNPFNPQKGDVVAIAIPESLKGSQLNIRIYNIAGQLVRTLDEDTTEIDPQKGGGFWDGRNDEGDLVSSGLYFFVAVSNKGKGRGKITLKRSN